MIILPLTYLPSVEWVARLCRQECIVDMHENYVKRSSRNRTSIMSANGVLSLSVPLQNANRPRTPICDIRIDYSQRWQHQHWMAILSAYRSSPYFDHFGDRFEALYNQRFEFLTDLNNSALEILLDGARLKPQITRSEQYVEPSPDCLDLRARKQIGSSFEAQPYYQTFSERYEFAPNLSFLDLLMCEGLASYEVLDGCQL